VSVANVNGNSDDGGRRPLRILDSSRAALKNPTVRRYTGQKAEAPGTYWSSK